MTIQPIQRKTVTEQIMEQIAGLITSGQWKAGQQLPNERDLAEQLQVTRGRVREALRALSLVGLITIKSGEGSFVNKQEVPIPAETITWMFHNELNNLHEVYAARKLIESEVYRCAAERMDGSHAAAIETFVRKLHDPQLREPAAFLSLLDDIDTFAAEHCGNRIYGKLMQTVIHLRRETSLKLLQVPGAIENSVADRTALLRALASGQTSEAIQAAAAFFATTRQFYDQLSGQS